MEGCPFNDYAYFDAAYNQGWIARESKFCIYQSHQGSNSSYFGYKKENLLDI